MTRLAALLVFVAGCGARSDLEVGDPAPAAPCTDPPWILVSHVEWPIADLYAVRPDGSDLHRVALDDPQVGYPTVSADGRYLAYVIVAEDPAPSVLAILDTLTGTTQRATLGESVTYPAFSPDGSLVAFADGVDLRVARRDGTDARTLIRGPYDVGCCSWGYGHPVFLDATTILWTTAGITGSIGIDGTGMTTELVSDFRSIPFANVTLSPDRTRLAAVIACEGTFMPELRAYDVASLPVACESGRVVAGDLLGHARITHVPNPSWGPTDLVAFTQDTDVFVVAVEGGTPRNVTSPLTSGTDGAAGNPTWAPGCMRLPR